MNITALNQARFGQARLASTQADYQIPYWSWTRGTPLRLRHGGKDIIVTGGDANRLRATARRYNDESVQRLIGGQKAPKKKAPSPATIAHTTALRQICSELLNASFRRHAPQTPHTHPA